MSRLDLHGHPLRREAHGASDRSRPSRERWLLSYADFVTLLLALFVVLYAGAAVQETQEARLLEGLRSAFVSGSLTTREDAPGAGGASDEASDAPKAGAFVPVPALARLEEELERVIERAPRTTGGGPDIGLRQTERGLIVTLASTAFFPEGGAEIPQERKASLAAMAPLLNATTSSILFEGHTDAAPVIRGPFPSNWELSSARAAAVARLFVEEHGLAPERVTTTGHAGYRPLADNREAEGRARNRRVEIVILADGELVGGEEGARARSQLDALLEALPPLPEAPDEGLRAPDPGPQPEDIPLP